MLPGIGADPSTCSSASGPSAGDEPTFEGNFYAGLPAVVDTLSRDERADPESLAAPWDGLARLAFRSTGMPLMARSSFRLLDGAEAILREIIADVERAASSVEMEFYIWNAGGTADEVAAALARAVDRGVKVRLLLDALGSKEFLKTGWPDRMRSQGIDLQVALAVDLWRVPFRRIDLRLHRKIVVVDGRIAYTGSMNLVDPRYFKQGAGVGEWVDAMARAEGPVVGALARRLPLRLGDADGRDALGRGRGLPRRLGGRRRAGRSRRWSCRVPAPTRPRTSA